MYYQIEDEGLTVCEADTIAEVIAEAESFFWEEAMEDKDYGYGEKEVTLVCCNDDGTENYRHGYMVDWEAIYEKSDREEHGTLWNSV